MPKTLAQMTAQSVVLSVLLGAHPASATAAELIRLTSGFGIKETALRVALTRMVSAGDLVRSSGGYRLSDRLLARQRRQDEAISPRVRAWRGYWTTLVVTSVGSDARTRAALRTTLHDKRFSELREGVWMRPDNLDLGLDTDIRARVRILTARDDAPAELAGQLWDLSAWALTGHHLLAEIAAAADVPGRFVVAAAIAQVEPCLRNERSAFQPSALRNCSRAEYSIRLLANAARAPTIRGRLLGRHGRRRGETVTSPYSPRRTNPVCFGTTIAGCHGALLCDNKLQLLRYRHFCRINDPGGTRQPKPEVIRNISAELINCGSLVGRIPLDRRSLGLAGPATDSSPEGK
jgi:phenylacetic acid degradation operon negative regulatory protein